MTYATIMVHAEASEQAEPRLRLAADIANQFNAKLIGVGAEIYLPVLELSSLRAMELQNRAIDLDIEAAHRRFDPIASHATAGREWRAVQDRPASALIHQARAADLIVMGPARAGSDALCTHADPGDVLMRSGRPILLAPAYQTRLGLCRMVVAWKDTPQSQRAVHDALPLLKRASRVKVVEICGVAGRSEAKARVDDVVASLRRHGVTAESDALIGSDAKAGPALLEHCSGWDADLLVAGGYGRSRAREWIFGGVTRDLLGGSPTPVLLSH